MKKYQTIFRLISFFFFTFSYINLCAQTATNLPPVTDGLVGFWPFNNDANDYSTKNNNANFTDVTFVQGRTATEIAASFDGNNSIIRIPNSSDLEITGNYTINCWIKPYSYGEGNYGRIVDKRNDYPSSGYLFCVYNPSSENGLFIAKIGVDDQLVSNAVTLNQWQMITITFNGASLKFYRTSAQTGNTTTELYSKNNWPHFIASGQDLLIGNNANLGRGFDGLIDDLCIYNKALTIDDIQSLYSFYPNAPISVAPADPSSFIAQVLTPGQIELSWVDNADNETGFVLERSTVSDFSSIEAAYTLAENATSYTDNNGIAANTTYYYQLKAVNSTGSSNYVAAQHTTEGDSPVTDCSQIYCDGNGNVGIGTEDTHGYKLAIAGGILSEEVKVQLMADWPDYVFNSNYKLKTLSEIEDYISDNKHLPGVPSEKDIEDNGLKLGEMDAILLKKIEELTLYVIELNKKLKEQEEKNGELERMIKNSK